MYIPYLSLSIILSSSPNPIEGPAVKVGSPAVRSWVSRIVGPTFNTSLGKDQTPLELRITPLPKGTPPIRIQLDTLTSSTTATCVSELSPALSCAIQHIEPLGQALAHTFPKDSIRILEAAKDYRKALIWLRARILSELGNNDLNDLKIAVTEKEFIPQLTDIGLTPSQVIQIPLPPSKDKLKFASAHEVVHFEVLFHPIDAPLSQSNVCRQAKQLCLALKRLGNDAPLDGYDRVIGFNLKQALEAVQMIGEARRHPKASP